MEEIVNISVISLVILWIVLVIRHLPSFTDEEIDEQLKRYRRSGHDY